MPALLVLIASQCAAQRATGQDETRSPTPLVGVPGTSIVQWPSLTRQADTIFVAGNVFRGDSLPDRPAYLGRLRLSGADSRLMALSAVELPRGDFQFAYPRVIATRGKLHLVWAEFANRPRTPNGWQQATYLGKSLWHAVLDHGAWSTPERIATGDVLGWSDEVGTVGADSAGTVYVAVWKGDYGSVPHVNAFRLIENHWEHSALPYSGLNTATAIAVRGDTAIIGLVDERLDTARVMVLESTDEGKHWSNPTIASARSRLRGTVTQLAFAPSAFESALVIGEKAEGSFYLDTVRVLRLEGSRVRSSLRFLAPPSADQFVATGTPCGSMVVLFRELSAAPHIIQSTLSPHAPSPVSRPLLSGAGLSVFPGIIATPRSVIAVFANSQRVGAPVTSAAMAISVCPQ